MFLSPLTSVRIWITSHFTSAFAFYWWIARDFAWPPVCLIQSYVVFLHTQRNLELDFHFCVVKADNNINLYQSPIWIWFPLLLKLAILCLGSKQIENSRKLSHWLVTEEYVRFMAQCLLCLYSYIEWNVWSVCECEHLSSHRLSTSALKSYIEIHSNSFMWQNRLKNLYR